MLDNWAYHLENYESIRRDLQKKLVIFLLLMKSIANKSPILLLNHSPTFN